MRAGQVAAPPIWGTCATDRSSSRGRAVARASAFSTRCWPSELEVLRVAAQPAVLTGELVLRGVADLVGGRVRRARPPPWA
jgi:hypothetical protein